MAENIVKLKVDSQEYESKIKRASQGLQALSQSLQNAGKTFVDADAKQVEFTRELGKMQTVSNTAKGKIAEMSAAFVNLKSQYLQMTEAEKQSPFGQAMSKSLEQLKIRTIDAKRELESLNRELNDTKIPDMSGGGFFSGMGDKLSGMLQVFGGNLMTKGYDFVVGNITSLASEISGAVKQGIELAKQGEGIRIAFERLGRGDILNGLREATHGTVTDIELMKAAVKFNDFKLPIEELGTMLAFAQQKAKDTGQSVDYMVDSIVTGLGRKSLMILDNLGLSAAEIKEKMAETGDMTKAVGEIIREQMSKAGDYVETAADRAAQANVSLQNKMEELGRKFAPIEEASNHLWTSMKIGILDIIGGPLATLLNNLTEAGRLRNQLNKMNGDPSTGQPTKVQQQLSTLRGSKYKNANYKGQLAQYDKQIGDLNFKIAAYGGKGKDAIEQGQVQQLKLQRDALKAMRSEYVQGAKDIMKPVETNIKTDKAEQNVKTLTAQLKELEKQRKEAVKKGDQEQVEALTKQISQTKTNLGYLDPSAVKTTTGKSKQQQSEDKVAAALQDYQQTIDKASLELKSGAATEADVKKKQLSAQERLYDAYGDAYALYKDPKYKDAQDKAAAEIVKLGGEVKAATEAQEAARKAARELESAQKKLADAQREMNAAELIGNRMTYLAAAKKVAAAETEVERIKSEQVITVNTVPGTVNLPDIPKEVEQIVNTKVGEVVTPEIATEIVQTISTKLGYIITPEIAEQLTQTINTKVGKVITPDIAKELTQVVNVKPGTVNLPDIPKNVEQTVTFKADDAEVLSKVQDIEGITIDPKTLTVTADTQEAINAITKINGMTIQPKTITFKASTFKASTDNLSAEIADLKSQLGQTDYGSEIYQSLSARIADANAVSNLIQTAVKNGLNIDQEVVGNFWSQIIRGADIPDEDLQSVVDAINQFFSDHPIKLDFTTGEIEKDDGGKKNKGKKDDTDSNKTSIVGEVGKIASGVSSIVGGIEALGVKIPDGLKAVINGIQGVVNILTGISSIVTAIQTLQTASSIKFFAGGGIVGKAASGMVIPGNSFSGDNLRMPVWDTGGMIGVNSGEVILNRAQAGIIASELQGGAQQAISSTPYVTGEQIYLGLGNYLRRSGRGELLTARR